MAVSQANTFSRIVLAVFISILSPLRSGALASDDPLSPASSEPSQAEHGDSDRVNNPVAPDPSIIDEQVSASAQTTAEPTPTPAEESPSEQSTPQEPFAPANSENIFSMELVLEAAGESIEPLSISCANGSGASCADASRIYELPELKGEVTVHWNLIGDDAAFECTVAVYSGIEPYSPTTIERQDGARGSWRAATDTRWLTVDFTCLDRATGMSRNVSAEVARVPVLFQDPPARPVAPNAEAAASCLQEARSRYPSGDPARPYDPVSARQDLSQPYPVRARAYNFLFAFHRCLLETIRPRSVRDVLLRTFVSEFRTVGAAAGTPFETTHRLRILASRLTEWLTATRANAAREMASELGGQILADPVFAQRLRITQSLQNVGAEFLSTNCRGAEALLRSALLSYDDFALRDLEVFHCHESNDDRELDEPFSGSFDWIVAHANIMNNNGGSEEAPFREAIMLTRDVTPDRFELLIGKGDGLGGLILRPRDNGAENQQAPQDLPLQLNLSVTRALSNYEDYVLEVEPGSIAAPVYRISISNPGVHSPFVRPSRDDRAIPLPFYIPGVPDYQNDTYRVYPLSVPFWGSGVPLTSRLETPEALELYIRETIRERLRARNQVGLQVEQTAIADATPLISGGSDTPVSDVGVGTNAAPDPTLEPAPEATPFASPWSDDPSSTSPEPEGNAPEESQSAAPSTDGPSEDPAQQDGSDAPVSDLEEDDPFCDTEYFGALAPDGDDEITAEQATNERPRPRALFEVMDLSVLPRSPDGNELTPLALTNLRWDAVLTARAYDYFPEALRHLSGYTEPNQWRQAFLFAETWLYYEADHFLARIPLNCLPETARNQVLAALNELGNGRSTLTVTEFSPIDVSSILPQLITVLRGESEQSRNFALALLRTVARGMEGPASQILRYARSGDDPALERRYVSALQSILRNSSTQPLVRHDALIAMTILNNDEANAIAVEALTDPEEVVRAGAAEYFQIVRPQRQRFGNLLVPIRDYEPVARRLITIAAGGASAYDALQARMALVRWSLWLPPSPLVEEMIETVLQNDNAATQHVLNEYFSDAPQIPLSHFIAAIGVGRPTYPGRRELPYVRLFTLLRRFYILRAGNVADIVEYAEDDISRLSWQFEIRQDRRLAGYHESFRHIWKSYRDLLQTHAPGNDTAIRLIRQLDEIESRILSAP